MVASKQAAFEELDAAELLSMQSAQEIQLIDVRNIDEVLRGVIAGAIHIQLAQLPQVYAKLAQDKPLVFYCHSGIRSSQAAGFMADHGYHNVYNLRGGVLAWSKSGYAFTKL